MGTARDDFTLKLQAAIAADKAARPTRAQIARARAAVHGFDQPDTLTGDRALGVLQAMFDAARRGDTTAGKLVAVLAYHNPRISEAHMAWLVRQDKMRDAALVQNAQAGGKSPATVTHLRRH